MWRLHFTQFSDAETIASLTSQLKSLQENLTDLAAKVENGLNGLGADVDELMSAHDFNLKKMNAEIKAEVTATLRTGQDFLQGREHFG